MTTYVSDLEEAVIQHYQLPWPKVDENAYPAVVTTLNTYADFVLEDGWNANGHMQRLLSTGQGEALTALREHWDRVLGKDIAPVAQSAKTLANTVYEIPQTIATLKQAIAMAALNLASSNGITKTAEGLSFVADAGAGAAVMEEAAARNANVVRQKLTEMVLSAESDIRRSLTALLETEELIALESVPSDLSNGVGGAVAPGDGITGAVGGVAGWTTGGGMAGGVAGWTTGDAQHAGGNGGAGGDLAGDTGVRVDHDEHKIAASRIASVSDDVLGRTSAELANAASQHATARDSGDFAKAFAPDIDLILDRLAAATAAIGDHLAGALPDAILLISNDQQATDNRNRKNFGEL
ncbi:hypothetical protein [Streptomyces sp. NPDC004284]|uniref:hypothetical protein n=1 Tax=Streptomyces sp. NPDC004284 TaxID=3364695 RepID=UPI003673C02A